MKSRVHDPLRLDIGAAAAEGATLSGRWPLAHLQRLQADAVGGDGAGASDAEWSARFEQRAATGAAPQPWLHLRARASVARACQRCLQPVLVELEVDRVFRFAPTEDEAAALDADGDDDVLAASHRFDLCALVEDELLLALPLVPKHDICPEPWQPEPPAPADLEREHPFAALAALKTQRRH
jgi:uncharacterized protein